MNKKQKNWLKRILLALALFFTVMALDELGVLAGIFGEPGALYASFALYLIPYLIAGHDVLLKAWRNIRRGEAFDESFLMAVATIGAFAMIFFPETEPHMAEGAAVMLFYQVGELFQSYAVGKSRKSIAAMMDIAPDYANIERGRGRCRHALLPGGRTVPKLCRGQEPQVHRRHDGHRPRLRQHRARRRDSGSRSG